jgi:hypothetical protein
MGAGRASTTSPSAGTDESKLHWARASVAPSSNKPSSGTAAIAMSERIMSERIMSERIMGERAKSERIVLSALPRETGSGS